MPETEKIKLKICLVGKWGVGKTSLIRRFVFDAFREAYVSTIGTKVTKKDLKIRHPSKDEEVDVSMLIWDIMGQKGFRELLQEAYFFGAQGVIAMCDITNKDSLNELSGWIDSTFSVTGKIPIAFLANKFDLKHKAQFSLDEFKDFASKFERSIAYTSSAKTGENVEETFEKLTLEILKE